MTIGNFDFWWGFAQTQRPVAPSCGWTLETWRDARARAGYRDLSHTAFGLSRPEDLRSLAHSWFWSHLCKANDLPLGSDLMLVDWVFTDGGGAIRQAQFHLGFPPPQVDGLVGPLTLRAIETRGKAFVGDCWRWRVEFYDRCGLANQGRRPYDRALAARLLAQEALGITRLPREARGVPAGLKDGPGGPPSAQDI